MKVKDLIVQLSGCDQEAYVTDRECRGVDRVLVTEYEGKFDEEHRPIVILHVGYTSDFMGE